MKITKYLFYSIIIIFILAPEACFSNENAYRVIIDPGHGGLCLNNRDVNGDRHDSISGKYLMDFAEGASSRSLSERILVNQIAIR